MSLLFVLLMSTTLWLGLSLFKFKKSPYLSSWAREILSDYALPLAVILVSLLAVIVFSGIPINDFKDDPTASVRPPHSPDFESISISVHLLRVTIK